LLHFSLTQFLHFKHVEQSLRSNSAQYPGNTLCLHLVQMLQSGPPHSAQFASWHCMQSLHTWQFMSKSYSLQLLSVGTEHSWQVSQFCPMHVLQLGILQCECVHVAHCVQYDSGDNELHCKLDWVISDGELVQVWHTSMWSPEHSVQNLVRHSVCVVRQSPEGVHPFGHFLGQRQLPRESQPWVQFGHLSIFLHSQSEFSSQLMPHGQ